ncbi:MAG TPA: DUF2807 domain-containing protein [Bacteroidia bacterium]|nr:DUF2807 domain-containing protein [Bacteroidia bacterium]
MKILNFRHSVAILFILFLTACRNETIQPSGLLVMQKRPCTEFNSIIINLPANVRLIPSENHEIHVETDDNLLDYVKSRVRNRQLIIYSNRQYLPFTELNIDINFNSLKKLYLNGQAWVYSDDTIGANKIELTINDLGKTDLMLKTKDLKVILRGRSFCKLAGQSGFTSIKASGICKTDAFALTSDSLDLLLRQESEARVSVKKQITGKIKNNARLLIKGNPVMEVEKLHGAFIVYEN